MPIKSRQKRSIGTKRRSPNKSEFKVSDIDKIRSRYKGGTSMAQLARDYNTSNWQIQRILRTPK